MLGIGLVALLSANETAVQVWGDTVGLPTYTEGLPSDAPHFSILDDKYNPYYPYTTRKNFQLERTVQYWRVVHLQNEFLHCMVMPDLRRPVPLHRSDQWSRRVSPDGQRKEKRYRSAGSLGDHWNRTQFSGWS